MQANPVRYFDSHNHLQDDRLRPFLDQICSECPVERMVVNGSCESDWEDVRRLSTRFPFVLPSFGYHPWYIRERTSNWLTVLASFLDQTPGSVIGEVGLDRWIQDFDLPDQTVVFLAQLSLAVDRQLPVTIHCLKAWGHLYDLLSHHRLPQRGFLLHSYGGPVEMVLPLAKLGAYFSFPGYFLHDRKERQRATFRVVPLDRLLIETDAPDQMPPARYVKCPLLDHPHGQPLNSNPNSEAAADRRLNHPANLIAIYEGLADVLQMPLDTLAAQVEENFHRLFLTARIPHQ